MEYLARNPERAGLVRIDGHREYPFIDCLVPGYPELQVWQDGFWQTYWRVIAHLQRNGLGP